MTETLQDEARLLASKLFKKDLERAAFAGQLAETCEKARDKDFLIIHNPGGFGGKDFAHDLQWERNVVNGICAEVGKLGFSWVMLQHFRASRGWFGLLKNLKELTWLSSSKVKILASEIEFVTRHLPYLKILLIGVSHGAAFCNLVMQHLTGFSQVYSIEIGIFFPYRERRVIGERTLAIDSNGTMPDYTLQGNMAMIGRSYFLALFRWLKYRLRGQRVPLAHCVNVPGHNYDWSYPYIRRRIEDFLEASFAKTTSRLNRGLL